MYILIGGIINDIYRGISKLLIVFCNANKSLKLFRKFSPVF